MANEIRTHCVPRLSTQVRRIEVSDVIVSAKTKSVSLPSCASSAPSSAAATSASAAAVECSSSVERIVEAVLSNGHVLESSDSVKREGGSYHPLAQYHFVQSKTDDSKAKSKKKRQRLS